LQDDLKIIERESKISRSGTNSVPIDASASGSGFVPSMIEKARNLGELSNTMKSSERTSLLSPMQQKSEKIKETKKESDDEYVDDEFDFEDEEESGKKPQTEKKEEVDFAISASASMLPPLSG
jgi:hypothetical protein